MQKGGRGGESHTYRHYVWLHNAIMELSKKEIERHSLLPLPSP